MNVIEALYGSDLRYLRTGGFHDSVVGCSLDANEIRARVRQAQQAISAAAFHPARPVILWTTPPSSFAINYLACLSKGLIVIPFDPEQPAAEQTRRARLTGARHVIADRPDNRLDWAGRAELEVIDLTHNAKHLSNASSETDYPGGAAQVLFTSGSTGPSKAAVVTHANLLSNARATLAWARYTEQDGILGILPFFHCYPILHCLLTPLMAGASVFAAGRFSVAATIDAMKSHPITVFPGVPAIFEIMIRQEGFRSIKPKAKLRYAESGGAVLRAETQRLFHTITGAPLLNAYGITEATSFVAAPPLNAWDQSPNSIGSPVQGVTVRARDQTGALGMSGELEIGGGGVMAGYLQDPTATRQVITSDGWLRTGDQVRIEPSGEIFYTGRLKNVINRGGEKVHPEAVERVLADIPWVHGIVVVGVPDEVMGESVMCLIEATPEEFRIEDLRRHADFNLAPYERPEKYVRVDAIPRNATGKVRREHARSVAADLRAASPPDQAPGPDRERGLDL